MTEKEIRKNIGKLQYEKQLILISDNPSDALLDKIDSIINKLQKKLFDITNPDSV